MKIHARAGSQTRVRGMGGLRDAARRALAQASTRRATTPWRNLPTPAQTWAVWWPVRSSPERENSGTPVQPQTALRFSE